MKNINTREYWENRFKTKDWDKSGQRQTRKYAIANVENLNIEIDFNGTFLDYGCALGDAIPIYLKAFPNAKIIGMDISEEAIKICNQRFGKYAKFFSGDDTVVPIVDIIIASHVMEHITEDKRIVRKLLHKCKNLYVFVPYCENPLYIEHVNYYGNDYYDDFNVIDTKIFTVGYKKRIDILSILKNLVRFKFTYYYNFSKDIIMYQISS